ncbi:MAG: alanine racemase [Nitrospirae bacterium]|nr:alanine racemase [Nitrospirota bacterium]
MRSLSVALAGRPTVAEIDLSALSANLRLIRKRIGPGREILAVVKADAYGHGAGAVSKQLMEEGVERLGVATVEEGAELREAGITVPTLLLGGLFPEDLEGAVAYDLTPVVYHSEILEPLSRVARHTGKRVPVHVKVDTGMGRVGVPAEQAVPFIRQVVATEGIVLEGLMTHFADADLADKSFASRQLALFESLIRDLRGSGIAVPCCHVANSAAVLDFPPAFFNCVRPGLLLYGCLPFPRRDVGADPEVRGVLRLNTRVLYVKEVPTGTPISYGRTFITRRPSRIATLPIGYADGYSRALSNRGEVLIRGKRVPVVGRVCMDLTMVDVTDAPEAGAGDEAVLIGRQGEARITAEEVAERAGTIPYEILCGIGRRVRRVYVG